MTTITGSVKQFKEMFKHIMCGSKNPLFTDIELQFDNESINVNSIDQTRAIATVQKYRNFIIDGNESILIDTISINDAINLFDDNDELVIDSNNNIITLSVNSNDKKDVIKIPISDVNNLKSGLTYDGENLIMGDNKVEFDAQFMVDVKHVKTQIKRAKYVASTYHEYDINIDNNTLILSVGDVNNFELSSSSEINIDGKGIAKSRYCYGYDDIFSALSDEVTIKLSSVKPMIVTQSCDDYSVMYLIAPVVPSD